MRLALAIGTFLILAIHGVVFYNQFSHRWERNQIAYYLQEKYGADAMYRSGFRIYTTIDERLQEAAYDAVTQGVRRIEEANKYKGLQGALLCMDPGTGGVLAMVGGVDFGASQFNRALQARRLLDVHLGLLDFIRLCYLDERLDQRRQLLDLGELLQVLLRQIGPLHPLVLAFADLDLHAQVIRRGDQQFARERLAIGELEGLGISRPRQQAAYQPNQD